MSYHKENLKEQLIEIAWEICNTGSWQKVNMRRVAEQAGVSTTAFYRHFKSKSDLQVELMLRGFAIIEEGRKDLDKFSSYGAHYIRFGLAYPHIYDLMFGNIGLDMSQHPELVSKFDEAFAGIIEGIKPWMPDASERDQMIKALNIWASVHGLVGILRRGIVPVNKADTLRWIENNLEDYLEMTTLLKGGLNKDV